MGGRHSLLGNTNEAQGGGHMMTALSVCGVFLWAGIIICVFLWLVMAAGKFLFSLLVILYNLGRRLLGMELSKDYDGMLFPHR